MANYRKLYLLFSMRTNESSVNVSTWKFAMGTATVYCNMYLEKEGVRKGH